MYIGTHAHTPYPNIDKLSWFGFTITRGNFSVHTERYYYYYYSIKRQTGKTCAYISTTLNHDVYTTTRYNEYRIVHLYTHVHVVM